MTTSPKAVPLADTLPAPVIPLAPDVRAAYDALNAKLEEAIEATKDVAALQELNASQYQVDDVLSKDGIYRIQTTTKLYHDLLGQINETNRGLKDLQEKIVAVSGGFAHAGEVLALIATVLKIVPIP